MNIPMRRFRLRANRTPTRVPWLKRHMVYEGRLLSMTGRVVRLFAPDAGALQKHVDIPYDWVTPVP